jgi:Pyridoxamine 5'-phosphate oxidase
MARWADVERSEPAFAAAVRQRLDAHRHKTIATLRADGSPRISGVETTFADGDLWLGMMPGSRKAVDLRRDPRLALHSGSPDPDDADPSRWPGDAKLSGRAEEVTDPEGYRRYAGDARGAPEPGSFHLFRIEIDDVTLIRIGDPPDRLEIETWRPRVGLSRVERT